MVDLLDLLLFSLICTFNSFIFPDNVRGLDFQARVNAVLLAHLTQFVVVVLDLFLYRSDFHLYAFDMSNSIGLFCDLPRARSG